MNKKNLILRTMLTSRNSTDFLMEAHNGLSGKIAEKIGFKALWGSGFSISSAFALRDANEASWTQFVDILETIVSATSIPILADGDTGYGNFNNFRQLVKKLEQRGVSGVCIEDKIFPKKNSFVRQKEELADVEEFCGKIKAGKDTQIDNNFSIVARVEALVLGYSMTEALERAEAYFEAGADAVLIHSKKNTACEVLEFADRCPSQIPLVIVPTKYYQTPTEQFINRKISTIIWANQSLRSSYKAMIETVRKIYATKTLVGVEDEIAPMDDIFSLLEYEELDVAERKYLPEKVSI